MYSPEAWQLSQGFDYRQMLHKEVERLTVELEKQFSWETKRQLDNVRQELELTNRSIALLAEKVRQRWTN